MRHSLLLLFFLFFGNFPSFAEAPNEGIDSNNIVKIDACESSFRSKPSIIDKVTASHNLQKKLDVSHQEKIIEYSVNTKRTIHHPDGRVEIIETSPSNVTLEAISQDKDKYSILENGASKAGFALILFKMLGGL